MGSLYGLNPLSAGQFSDMGKEFLFEPWLDPLNPLSAGQFSDSYPVNLWNFQRFQAHFRQPTAKITVFSMILYYKLVTAEFSSTSTCANPPLKNATFTTFGRLAIYKIVYHCTIFKESNTSMKAF